MNKLEPFVRYYLDLPPGYIDYADVYEEMLGCKNGDSSLPTILCLGEMAKVSGHYTVVALNSGRVLDMLHPEIFKEFEE